MSTTLEVAQHFSPGSTVEVHPRVTDHATGSFGSPVKTVRVPASGQVSIDGLEGWGDYWLVGPDGNTVAFTAQGKATDDLAEEQQLRSDANHRVREQARLTGEQFAPGAVQMPSDIHPSNFEKSKEPEAVPRAKQADVSKSTPQRTGADIGTAYPVDPAEIQPQPAQQHVKDGVPQRSDTELGYASPVAPTEVQPNKKYEDQTGPQRLGADTGQAEPIAKGSVVCQDEVKDAAVSKAKGATVPKAGTDKVSTAKKTQTKKATPAQAKKVDEPVKPSAARAQVKGEK